MCSRCSTATRVPAPKRRYFSLSTAFHNHHHVCSGATRGVCEPHGDDQGRVCGCLVRQAPVRTCQRFRSKSFLLLSTVCRYALKCIAEQRGEALPELFLDEGWRLLHHDIMYVQAQCAFVHRCRSSPTRLKHNVCTSGRRRTAVILLCVSSASVTRPHTPSHPHTPHTHPHTLAPTHPAHLTLTTMSSAFIEYLPYTGPVVSDGFGLGYIIKDEGMQICCTSFRCPIFYHGFLQARGPFVV
jgi:hypothetical protein